MQAVRTVAARSWLVPIAVTVVLVSAHAATVQACGPNSNCEIGDRIYRIRMPQGHDGKTPIGAIVFAHGYKGNVRSAVQSRGLAIMARKLNVAIIATKSADDDWSIPHAPSDGTRRDVDELAYFDRVLEDAARRFPIDRSRLVMTGFSAGAMMVWTLACHRSQLFAGFVPIAGTFWRPTPATCTTPPTSVIHIHGDRDKTVPLDGRRVNDARQGRVHDVIAMYSRFGSFAQPVAHRTRGLRCQKQRNANGHVLSFCLYRGGHTFNIRHIRQAWTLLVAAGRL